MEEKDLVKRIKNSLRAKKSQAEILTGFQKRGYKLEYADKLISKAKRPKKIATMIVVIILVVFCMALGGYYLWSNQKTDLSNPSPFISGNQIATSLNLNQQRVSIDQIEITPEFISYLLNELTAWNLHTSPINFEKPIINFQVGEKEFYSEIGNDIKTYNGLSSKADLQFNTNKEDLILAITSNDAPDILRQSMEEGRTQLEIFASEVELFSKGYLQFYNSLK